MSFWRIGRSFSRSHSARNVVNGGRSDLVSGRGLLASAVDTYISQFDEKIEFVRVYLASIGDSKELSSKSYYLSKLNHVLATPKLRRFFSSEALKKENYENFFPKEKKEVPKNEQKSESKVYFRFSTASETSHEFLSEDNLLTFVESALNDLEGPHHCWINKVENSKDFLWRNGVFLILFGAFLKEPLVPGDSAVMFEKVKSLQQRYPLLHVMGFQTSGSIFSDAVRTRFVHITMKHYITFPILLSNKNFTEMTDRAYFGVFKGFKSSFTYYERDVNLETIDKAIKELMQHAENHEKRNDVKSPWAKQNEVIKQPHVCAFLHDLLLYFPGCISADEMGNHLFLSDINHHRIIIFDGSGKISDCIGSSPGFEDGEFESAKLMCPATSFYHAVDGCLYFVDSENHAVRRADMERRVVETLYPTSNANKKDNSFWSRIMNNLWMKRAVDTKSEYLDSESFLFPWHLIKSLDNDLFIANRSFETLWIMDLASGLIKEVVKGFPKIMEICGELIVEKSSLLKEIPGDWLQQLVGTHCPHKGIIYASVMSSLARFQDDIAICDTVGQRVLRLNRESGCISSFQFSNFGILGLPYWVSSSLERVCAVGEVSSGHVDHVQCFSLLPGRIDIQLNISIPEETKLAEPLQEGCVWRQARGAAIEVSGAENTEAASIEKIGVSQQWYDELDNLAFSEPESELSAEEENTCDENLQEGGVCIDCAIKTSPGTSEVIIHAALYLKLKEDPNSCEESKKKNAARIADILNPRSAKDQCVQFLMKSDSLEELVFMKPLCVKIKIDCRDHPKADNSKDIILTDSSIDVSLSLN